MNLTKMKISKPKLFAFFAIICVFSTYFFTTKLIGNGTGLGEIFILNNFYVLIGIFIGSILPAIAIFFALGISFQIPKFVEITEDEISFKLLFDRDSKRIYWTNVGTYQEKFWGVKLSVNEKDIALNLLMFSKKDRSYILEMVTNKT